MIEIFMQDKRARLRGGVWKGTRKYPIYYLGIGTRISNTKIIIDKSIPVLAYDGFRFLLINSRGEREIADGHDVELLFWEAVKRG